ncbi:MAG: hypothetical protein M1831_000109 [Alyxoria varia]|nr:MAG: hypothetical protein M1831_000109 [Alyxoria varia]
MAFKRQSSLQLSPEQDNPNKRQKLEIQTSARQGDPVRKPFLRKLPGYRNGRFQRLSEEQAIQHLVEWLYTISGAFQRTPAVKLLFDSGLSLTYDCIDLICDIFNEGATRGARDAEGTMALVALSQTNKYFRDVAQRKLIRHVHFGTRFEEDSTIVRRQYLSLCQMKTLPHCLRSISIGPSLGPLRNGEDDDIIEAVFRILLHANRLEQLEVKLDKATTERLNIYFNRIEPQSLKMDQWPAPHNGTPEFLDRSRFSFDPSHISNFLGDQRIRLRHLFFSTVTTLIIRPSYYSLIEACAQSLRMLKITDTDFDSNDDPMDPFTNAPVGRDYITRARLQQTFDQLLDLANSCKKLTHLEIDMRWKPGWAHYVSSRVPEIPSFGMQAGTYGDMKKLDTMQRTQLRNSLADFRNLQPCSGNCTIPNCRDRSDKVANALRWASPVDGGTLLRRDQLRDHAHEMRTKELLTQIRRLLILIVSAGMHRTTSGASWDEEHRDGRASIVVMSHERKDSKPGINLASYLQDTESAFTIDLPPPPCYNGNSRRFDETSNRATEVSRIFRAVFPPEDVGAAMMYINDPEIITEARQLITTLLRFSDQYIGSGKYSKLSEANELLRKRLSENAAYLKDVTDAHNSLRLLLPDLERKVQDRDQEVTHLNSIIETTRQELDIALRDKEVVPVHGIQARIEKLEGEFIGANNDREKEREQLKSEFTQYLDRCDSERAERLQRQQKATDHWAGQLQRQKDAMDKRDALLQCQQDTMDEWAEQLQRRQEALNDAATDSTGGNAESAINVADASHASTYEAVGPKLSNPCVKFSWVVLGSLSSWALFFFGVLWWSWR